VGGEKFAVTVFSSESQRVETRGLECWNTKEGEVCGMKREYQSARAREASPARAQLDKQSDQKREIASDGSLKENVSIG